MRFDKVRIPSSCPKQVIDSFGNVVVQVAFVSSFYFWDAWKKRKNIGFCMEDFLTQEHLTWFRDPKTFQMKKYIPYQKRSISKHLLSLQEEEKGWDFLYHGGPTENSASDFCLSVMRPSQKEEPLEKNCSHLRFVVPVSQFSESPEKQVNRMMTYWNMLEPFYGYAGIGIVVSSEPILQQSYDWIVKKWAKVFKALDVEQPLDTIKALQGGGIKGANWIVMLENQKFQELGGKQKLMSDLDVGFTFHAVDGGLMIQAGPSPTFGDVEDNLSFYRKLNAVLKPIRMKDQTLIPQELLERLDDVPELSWLWNAST